MKSARSDSRTSQGKAHEVGGEDLWSIAQATLTTLIKTGFLGVTDGRVHDAKDRNKPDGNERHWSSLERQLQTAEPHSSAIGTSA